MRPPEIVPGTVEQALYTWSRSNLSGGRGQGFTAVSPGLREQINWLAGLDLSGVGDFEQGVSESSGFPGWKKMVSTGTFAAGPVRVVYRKIASAGDDAVERNRPAIHMLIGRVEDLDFASVADDDPSWLTAEKCRLDQPPRLLTLDSAKLLPRRAEHDCATVDSLAGGLLKQLLSPPHVLEAELGAGASEPADLVMRLLVAVPTELWSAIELDWRVGSKGPAVRVEILEEASGPSAPGRAEQVGVGSCQLHGRADAALAGLPISQRRWSAFSALAAGGPLGPSGEARQVPPSSAPARSRLRAAIGTAVGMAQWDGQRSLTDAEAARALKEIEGLSEPGWLSELSPPECEALLGGIESEKVARACRSLGAPTVTTDELIMAWQRTGLAVVGAALLERIQRQESERPGEPVHWRLVPKWIKRLELEKLVGHLAKTEKGLNQLTILLRCGFLEDEHARRSVVAAIVAVDPRPKFLFETVLEREQVDPHLLVPVLREELDRFAEWKGLGPSVQGALKLGLREHKGAIERLLSQLRRDGHPEGSLD